MLFFAISLNQKLRILFGKKVRSRWFHAETITHATLSRWHNAPCKADSLLQGSLASTLLQRKWSTCVLISKFKWDPLKLIDNFMYFENCILSTEVMSICVLRRNGLLSIDYRSHGNLIYSIKWNGISSKQRLCQYYSMKAPHGHWRSPLTRRIDGSVQEYYELYWRKPGTNPPRNNSCTATYFPSLKPFEVDKKDMQ